VGHYDSSLPVESSDELGQLARNFNDMAAVWEQSEQARRRWVADISHELRTPLAVLRVNQNSFNKIQAIHIDFIKSIG